MSKLISTVSYFSAQLGENNTYGKDDKEIIVTWEKEDLHVYLETDEDNIIVQIRPVIDNNYGGGDWEMAYKLVGYCEIHGIKWTCEEVMISIQK